jgi:CMP-N,N'-diacetyllegionaminic acid synthase
MIGTYTVLAIIPARGGSTRIPDKNVKPLAGKPLIQHTFEQIKASGPLIDRTILISDDERIAALAQEHGIEWPFKEPEHLADGTKPDFAFVQYALEWLRDNEGYVPDIVVQLRPTSPLRTAEDIRKAIELLAAHPEADSVRTVTEPEQSPYKMYRIDETGLLSPLITIDGVPESFNLPQQKLPKAYKHVGYVDAIWSRTILEKKQMTGSRVLPLVIEGAKSGINTLEDWDWYEYLLRKKS